MEAYYWIIVESRTTAGPWIEVMCTKDEEESRRQAGSGVQSNGLNPGLFSFRRRIKTPTIACPACGHHAEGLTPYWCSPKNHGGRAFQSCREYEDPSCWRAGVQRGQHEVIADDGWWPT